MLDCISWELLFWELHFDFRMSFILFESQSYREREGEGGKEKILHTQISSPDSHCGQAWARLRPRTRNVIQVFHDGCLGSGSWLCSAVFQTQWLEAKTKVEQPRWAPVPIREGFPCQMVA